MPDPINLQLVLPYYLAALLGGYLCGSVPFGLLLTYAAGLGDIRKIGSGNIGATNVLRTGSKALAAGTLVLDAAKGALPVLIAKGYFGPDITVIAAFGAFVGHLFPVWLGFKGGKGVAVALGIMLALYWPAALAALATWIVVAAVMRLSSLAALYAAAAAPLYFWLGARSQFAELAVILAALIWYAHRANIGRLWAGTEPRIGGAKT